MPTRLKIKPQRAKASVHKQPIQTPTPKAMPVPLASNPFGTEEIEAAIAVLRSGKLTQGEYVSEMERSFLDSLGSPEHRSAMMLNSGSSANLLAAALLRKVCDVEGNHRREVLTPALTWSTTVAPLIQNGFTPVFVDVGEDYCMDAKLMERAITDRTVAIAPVHLLGHACDMTLINRAAHRVGLRVLEDCCEALGTQWDGKPVGTTGFTASFSFYYSHHASSIEGGMLLHHSTYPEATALREHGWIRGYPSPIRATFAEQHPDLDPRWIFDQLGYNLRSTEINAAIGLIQLGRQAAFQKERRELAQWYDGNLKSPWLVQRHVSARCHDNPFSYPLSVKADAPFTRTELARHLEAAGIETRPILSGNITRHPWFQRHPHSYRSAHPLAKTDLAHDHGLLIPCRPGISEKERNHIRDSIDRFLKQKTGKGLA